MIITKETDYALRILRVLLDGEKHSVAEMSETELIPNQFAYQILRKLSAGNLVRVSRGALGGCALKALESRLEILNEEFSLQHDRNPIESMKSRLKSPSSIMNKMHKRGLPLDFPTMQANIMDVAGVRVICSFEEERNMAFR